MYRWSVKDYLYKAMLCHLAMGSQSGDMSQAKDKFERYCDLLATFETSREAKFIVVRKRIE